MIKPVKTALISVFHKEGLDELLNELKAQNACIYSTGGTYDFLIKKGMNVKTVESLTSYPSILGGRVKTLHPVVFGGILGRRSVEQDLTEMEQYNMPQIDMVVVDLYPFAQTVAAGGSEAEIIEKIDIGGVSLIRAAAKNFKDVWIIPSSKMYGIATELLKKQGGSKIEDRAAAAAEAIAETASYDSSIATWLKSKYAAAQTPTLPIMPTTVSHLRYGENPHQKGFFLGRLEDSFVQLHGKEISYNNLLDIDAAFSLMGEFPLFCKDAAGSAADSSAVAGSNANATSAVAAIIKHSNPCGWAIRPTLLDAYKDALACDPVSAYGGVVVCNGKVTDEVATEMHKLFIEVLIAPDYSDSALEILKGKKNRVILKANSFNTSNLSIRSCVSGYLYQEKDQIVDNPQERQFVTSVKPDEKEMNDLNFANILVKHCKSNAIVLVKNGSLLASGVGQTSRVDALKQALEKAISFGFDLQGAVLASDAFFPFSDCVEIAHKSGVVAFIQPGGSVRDQDSVDYCEKNHLKMVVTGVRHFRH